MEKLSKDKIESIVKRALREQMSARVEEAFKELDGLIWETLPDEYNGYTSRYQRPVTPTITSLSISPVRDESSGAITFDCIWEMKAIITDAKATFRIEEKPDGSRAVRFLAGEQLKMPERKPQ